LPRTDPHENGTLLGLVLTLLVGGCSSLPGAVIDTVDGRQTEHVVAGQGSPVVVFENGLGGSLDWWSKVWPEAIEETRALVYHRAGYGNSATTDRPRDGAHIVEELRALLKARQLAPPYVLVGHSLGGLYMQLFAR
jgi:pimeloyl-ACP methyl ester carboxylesterase